MKIGMILLGEAGNYGDDLILIAVLRAIAKGDSESEATFLSFGNNIPLSEVRELFNIPRVVTRAGSRRDLPGSRYHQNLFQDSDVVLVGGGGLIQTSQYSLKPFQWLRHLPDTTAPVIGIGLGIGPINNWWSKYFQQHDSPFDELFVREPYSQMLAKEFGWESKTSVDFIDETFMDEFTGVMPKVEAESSLGVALRSWPGLEARQVADHIHGIAQKYDLEKVRYFVLESKHGKGPDVDFTRQVASLVDLPSSEIHIYTSDNILEFTQNMRRPSVAISMKLHSSAFWAHRQIPMYPIIYAPKISDYFGLDFSGLQLIEHPVAPAPTLTRVRSEEALVGTLGNVSKGKLTGNGAHSLFSNKRRTLFQFEGLLINSVRKVGRIIRK